MRVTVIEFYKGELDQSKGSLPYRLEDGHSTCGPKVTRPSTNKTFKTSYLGQGRDERVSTGSYIKRDKTIINGVRRLCNDINREKSKKSEN